ncbi:MAG: hypothetical protein K2P39_10810 [Lachnospiraceae bacterium]|nr:hypothetical protein [Lachnospiraceae bacterium]
MNKTLKTVGIVLLLLGALLLFAVRGYMMPAFGTPVDIMAEGMEKAQVNKAVDTELDIVFECFSRQDSRDYHVVFVWDGDMYYVIPMAIHSENAGDFKKVVNETMDFAYGYTQEWGTQTAHFEGIIKELDDETAQKMKDWACEVGLFNTEAEAEEAMLPYLLYQTGLENIQFGISVVFLIVIIGLVLLCVGIFTPENYNVVLKLKETKINGVTYSVIKLRPINTLIIKGKKQQARDILTRDYHVDSGYAAFVVDNWNEYYY